jgi:hypothetical protein
LIIVKYSDEPERKRIEYAMDRWGEVMKLGRPDGVPIIVYDDNKMKELIDDLYARTSREKVSVYKLSEASFGVEETVKPIKVELNGDLETVEKLIGMIVAKQNATFKYEILSRKMYEVYTKKGRAEILTHLTSNNGRVTVEILIKGYGEAPELLHSKISNELKYL